MSSDESCSFSKLSVITCSNNSLIAGAPWRSSATTSSSPLLRAIISDSAGAGAGAGAGIDTDTGAGAGAGAGEEEEEEEEDDDDVVDTDFDNFGDDGCGGGNDVVAVVDVAELAEVSGRVDVVDADTGTGGGAVSKAVSEFVVS